MIKMPEPQFATGSAEWPDRALASGMALLRRSSGAPYAVVDVGAHLGETLSIIRAINPTPTRYFALEPNPFIFGQLSARVADLDPCGTDVVCLNVAAGPVSGKALFIVTKESAVAGILTPAEGLSERVPTGDHEVTSEVIVDMITLDDLMNRFDVHRLSLLKVDAEGFDLEVLRGASAAVSSGKIDIIVCETFFVSYRESQGYFWDIAKYLHNHGYYFVNLFDGRETGQGRLYTANGLWVSPSLASSNGFL